MFDTVMTLASIVPAVSLFALNDAIASFPSSTATQDVPLYRYILLPSSESNHTSPATIPLDGCEVCRYILFLPLADILACSAFVFAVSASSYTASAASYALLAFVSALAATLCASFAFLSSVGGALLFPVSHADPPATLTCTISPTAAFMVSATGVSSTPPGMWTHAVPPSIRMTFAYVS